MGCGMVRASLQCSSEECEVMSDKWQVKISVKKRNSEQREGPKRGEKG